MNRAYSCGMHLLLLGALGGSCGSAPVVEEDAASELSDGADALACDPRGTYLVSDFGTFRCIRRDDGDIVCWDETSKRWSVKAWQQREWQREAAPCLGNASAGYESLAFIHSGRLSIFAYGDEMASGKAVPAATTLGQPVLSTNEGLVLTAGLSERKVPLGDARLDTLRQVQHVFCWLTPGDRLVCYDTINEAALRLPLDENILSFDATYRDNDVYCIPALPCEFPPRPACCLEVIGYEYAAACVVHDAGRLSCFNPRQEDDTAYPVQYADGALVDDARLVAVGGDHVCFSRADDSVWCWGENTEGQLGQGRPSDVLEAFPVRMDLDREATIVQLEASWSSTCALYDDGELWCWGGDCKANCGPLPKGQRCEQWSCLTPTLIDYHTITSEAPWL